MRWGRRILAVLPGAAVLGGWLAIVAPAAVFDSPPQIGDREIVFTWSPDSTGALPDPYFSGNAVLEAGARITSIHPSGDPVRYIAYNFAGSEIYSLTDGGAVIRHWRTANPDSSVSPDYIPLDSLQGLRPTSLSLHRSDRRLLAGLPSGEVALWRLDSDANPEATLYPAGGAAILGCQFLPGGRDTTSIEFVTSGADDTLRVWSAPGRQLSAVYIPDGATGAIAVASRLGSSDYYLACGSRGGRLRVWDTKHLGSPVRILGDSDPLPAPVSRAVITVDNARIACASQSGQVRIWSLHEGVRLAGIDTGQNSPGLEFSIPAGKLLFAGLPDGVLQAYSGIDGRLYRTERIVDNGISSMTLSPDGEHIALGDPDGGITIARAGLCKPSASQPRCFGGYMVWRSPTPNPDDKVLMRVYTYSDSTWTFAGKARSFSDPDSIIPRTVPPGSEGGGTPNEPIRAAGPANGVPYYYSLTRFDLAYKSGSIFPVYVPPENTISLGFYRDPGQTDPTPLSARPSARVAAPLLQGVRVVPNPYEKGKSAWELPGEMHVEFQNLPEVADVRIYSLGGDFVRALHHDRDRYGNTTSTLGWDLKNERGEVVASGVYIYQVKSPSGEVAQGFFALVL